jgi:hypothetical protein
MMILCGTLGVFAGYALRLFMELREDERCPEISRNHHHFPGTAFQCVKRAGHVGPHRRRFTMDISAPPAVWEDTSS